MRTAFVTCTLFVAATSFGQACDLSVNLGGLGGDSFANAVSADGQITVGYAWTGAGPSFTDRAFVHDSAGLRDLGIWSGARAEATGISASGNTIVGWGWPGGGALRAFRWTQPTGAIDLGTLGGNASIAYAVSADGLVVVGGAKNSSDRWRAFRLAGTGPMTDLGTLGGLEATASAVSGNGAIVVGFASLPNGERRACRWTVGGSVLNLGTLGGTSSHATAVSADGSVVVGWSYVTPGSSETRAFRWTQTTGIQNLDLSGQYLGSTARACSSDGSVIVGSVQVPGIGWQGALWNHSDAAVLVGTEQAASGSAITPDATTIVGYAIGQVGTSYQAHRWSACRPACSFDTQPLSAWAPIGNEVRLHAQFRQPGHSYQWYRNGAPLSASPSTQGIDAPELILMSLAPNEQGSYWCVASGACGIVPSDTADVSCRPRVSVQPVGVAARAGDTITLSAGVQSSGTTTYRWKRDNINLFNSGAYSGVTTPTLTIQTNDPSQSGSYTLAITNPCGVTTTAPALVEISCAADWNGDDGVDGDDVILFFQQWDENDAAADFNGDGGVDGDDVIGFFGRWDVGC